jgi:hypothetical protein
MDGTTDEIVSILGGEKIFRYNIDLWQEYKLFISDNTFKIIDPTNREIDENHIDKLYIRKPAFNDSIEQNEGGSNEIWSQYQIKYIFKEIYNIFKLKNKVCLVEQGAINRFGKIMQMRLAKKYFNVPNWFISVNSLDPNYLKNSNIVVKTLEPEFTGNYKFLFTTEASINELDNKYPWFIQEKIIADFDVTIVYINGKIFPFRLNRKTFDTLDWREHIYKQNLNWEKCIISDNIKSKLQNFMQDANLNFGRFDFLQKNDEFYFLEINPNGQWAWLDETKNYGVFNAIIEELLR